MISPGRVSVIIPCYNYSDYLALSLRSVLSQSYKDWEVIIVNDGSCDSTEVVARDFAERYPSQISYFKIANSGVATARNLAIEHGTGEFILALDADDAITANALSRFVEQMRADANVAVVYSSVRFLDVPPGSPTIWNPGPILKRNLFTENFIPITSLWKRELFDSGIRYRDVLFEDWDLWVQIRARDKKFAYIPEALFEHRVHPFGRDSKNKYYYFQAVSQQALGTPKAYPQQLMEGASDVLANAPRCFELPSVVLLPSEASFEDSKRAQNWKERAELWAARGHTVYIVGSDPHGQIPQRPGVVKLGVNPQAWFGSVLYALERVGDDVIVISELESGRNLRLQRRSNVSVLVDLAESKNAFADINVIELQGGGSKVAFRDRPEETFYGSEGDLQESILTYYRNAIRTKKVQAIRQYIRHQRLARGASPDFLEKVDSYIEPLSIVIPVRNVDSRRLERCIQSIVSGDRSDSLEIVVSNFGSAPEY
ncbi:MAG: glycosyltransferase family 2 protein, partial [Bdellovibrionales bacterium]|nr:glycosyltransferase family 2 protein [Bdellovibrionales bacterium]